MKNTLLLLITTTLFALNVNAQSYSKYMNQGKNFYNKSQFLTALERFDLAYEFAKSDAQKDKAKIWKNKSRKKIRKQQDELKKTLNLLKVSKDSLIKIMKIAIIKIREVKLEKEKAQIALAKAEFMQLKVETAMFDKAVKEHFKNWKGYANTYEYNRLEVLKKVDTLNLSNNALFRLPKEVAECKNLKSINLLQNPDIDWEDCFEKLSKLTNLTEIKVSVYDLDNVPKKYWGKITGVEILKTGLSTIPENILKQKQLTYLAFSATWDRKNNFSNFPHELFDLKKLEYLNLTYCQIKSLPTEISELKELNILVLDDNKLAELPKAIMDLPNLERLYVEANNLSSLPAEIGNFKKIRIIDLSGNDINSLPPEIGKLSSLRAFFLESNKLNVLPNEVRYLTNLLELDIGYNEFLPEEKQKIKKLLPNCEIKF